MKRMGGRCFAVYRSCYGRASIDEVVVSVSWRFSPLSPSLPNYQGFQLCLFLLRLFDGWTDNGQESGDVNSIKQVS